jgi:hypothetical protein
MLRFRHLRLRCETAAGPFGADLTFDEGLNVIWADNTTGKSTCLQALLYALGLERMLSPKRDIPLTYVMTSHLDDPDTGQRHRILESSVWLEIQNAVGTIITVRRTVIGSANTKLVSVFDGDILSGGVSPRQHRDYFVLDPGAAQREAGFHKWLADFIGWELPTVKRYDGTDVLLYIWRRSSPFSTLSKKLGGRQFLQLSQRIFRFVMLRSAPLSSSLILTLTILSCPASSLPSKPRA